MRISVSESYYLEHILFSHSIHLNSGFPYILFASHSKTVAKNSYTLVRNWHICICLYDIYLIYSLVPGVSFDLFDSLYKPDAPKTTTVHVSDTRTDMLHCNKVGLVAETPVTNPLSCSGGIRALCPRASCTYTSQSTQWGVITNTYTLSVTICVYILVVNCSQYVFINLSPWDEFSLQCINFVHNSYVLLKALANYALNSNPLCFLAMPKSLSYN